MKSRLFLLLLLSLFPLRTATAEPANALRFGALIPLSGDFAPYGNHIREGIELAEERLQGEGIVIQTTFEDACLATEALRGAEKLVRMDKIDALVGSYCVIGIIPALPLFEKAKVLTFQTSEVPRELLKKSSFVFSTNARIEDEARELAKYAVRTLGLKQIAVIGLETQWGREFIETFQTAVEAFGGELVATENIPLGQNDFRSELTRLRRKSPQAIFFAHVGAPLGNALAQARALGLSVPFFTVSEAEEASLITSARNSSEGLRLFAPEPVLQSETMRNFSAQFLARFGHTPHPLSKQSFDDTLLAARALVACSGDKLCARDRLASTKDYSGASGRFSIDPDRGTSREFSQKEVKDGKFIPVESTLLSLRELK